MIHLLWLLVPLLAAIAAAFRSPAGPLGWTEGTRTVIGVGHVDTGIVQTFELTRGRRRLLTRDLPISVRLSGKGHGAFRTLALLVGEDADGDGVIRLAEWRIVGSARGAVSGDATVAEIAPVLVDDSDAAISAMWIQADGAPTGNQWSPPGVECEDPGPLVVHLEESDRG